MIITPTRKHDFFKLNLFSQIITISPLESMKEVFIDLLRVSGRLQFDWLSPIEDEGGQSGV